MIEKLLKIKELAERGSEGEKQNAKRMLLEMMERHGIDAEELEEKEKRYRYWFHCPSNQERTILFQTLRKIRDEGGSLSYWTRGRDFGLDITKGEYIKLKELWETYKKEWRKAKKNIIENALNAFLSKNNVFPSNAPKSKEEPDQMFWQLYYSLKSVELPNPKITHEE